MNAMTTTRKGKRVTKQGRPTLTQQDERTLELRRFSTALLALADLAPDRTTISQLSFFLFAAMADRSGRPATFTEIKEASGERLGKSLHTTYKIFLDAQRRSDRAGAKGLNWLYREEDPTDNRAKLLRLTPKGAKVVTQIVEAMGA